MIAAPPFARIMAIYLLNHIPPNATHEEVAEAVRMSGRYANGPGARSYERDNYVLGARFMYEGVKTAPAWLSEAVLMNIDIFVCAALHPLGPRLSSSGIIETLFELNHELDLSPEPLKRSILGFASAVKRTSAKLRGMSDAEIHGLILEHKEAFELFSKVFRTEDALSAAA